MNSNLPTVITVTVCVLTIVASTLHTILKADDARMRRDVARRLLATTRGRS